MKKITTKKKKSSLKLMHSRSSYNLLKTKKERKNEKKKKKKTNEEEEEVYITGKRRGTRYKQSKAIQLKDVYCLKVFKNYEWCVWISPGEKLHTFNIRSYNMIE